MEQTQCFDIFDWNCLCLLTTTSNPMYHLYHPMSRMTRTSCASLNLALSLPTCYSAPWMCQHCIPIFQLKRVSVPVARFFTFDGKHFKQLFGTSMGTKMALSMACLFIGRLEESMLSGVTKKPLMWTRYIDDVCLFVCLFVCLLACLFVFWFCFVLFRFFFLTWTWWSWPFRELLHYFSSHDKVHVWIVCQGNYFP